MSGSPPDWQRLYGGHPEPLVEELRASYERGSISYTAAELAGDASTAERYFSADEALALLEDAGGWLERGEEPLPVDPEFPDEPPGTVPRFSWRGEPRRRLGWLLFVHGMNTQGRWQEHLAFDIGLWQGLAVPTFIHKYGWIVLGVMLPWRRRKFQRDLRARLVALSREARKHKLRAAPDVVAHSFGTWLVGHVLLDELQRCGRGIAVGRLILTGSILRPSFPWAELQRQGLVEDVLNHYGTGDPVVPLAHWTIWDSGPSGRRGFDAAEEPSQEGAAEVINVAAPEFGHSEVFTDAERYASYSETWKPFLTNPKGSASRNIETADPPDRWREAWWPLQGTLLPLILLPLLLALLLLGLLSAGAAILSAGAALWDPLARATRLLAIAAAALSGLYLLHWAWLRLRR